ncbi:S-layer homology domain-containing protein [Paenibacillus puerhi]|uniref:S-layer homology domain-containing protein n=1 Tax=Paenibacillus puerhi TaxID=2692622 RepID=UPI00135AA8AF|nr:S-layer homology domain-containing protein [Paenibacillus puerhi]
MPRRQGLLGRVLAIMCFFTISMSSLSLAHAEGSPQFILTTSEGSTAVGNELKVSVKGLQLNDLYAKEITLTYDSTKLRFNSAVSDVSGGFTVDPILEGNKLQLAHTSLGDQPGVSGDRSLFTLSFTSIAAGTADIELDKIILVDSRLQSSEAAGGARASVSIGSGSSGGSGGSSDSSSGPVSPASPTPDPLKITDNGQGKKTVELPPAANGVKIAMSQIGSDPKTRLEIKKEGLSVEIPPEVLLQLRGTVSEEQLSNSILSFTMKPLPLRDADTLIDRARQLHQAGIKLSGHIYEFSLQLITGEHQAASLTAFTKPITLRLKSDPSLNAKLVSMYYIADDGKLEYIGGTYVNGELSAEIYHFSKYAALEYTKTFADVPHNHWAKPVITELAAKHIVSGTSDTDFEPERMVTRAEFTALLARTLHLTAKGNVDFTDVSAADWFYPEVAMAVKAGIVQGKSETTFAPEASISREEMVAMLVRAYHMQHKEAILPSGAAFDDEDAVSPWALAYVKNARALRLIEGREANLFVPHGVGTRAEASQLIMNFLGLQ